MFIKKLSYALKKKFKGRAKNIIEANYFPVLIKKILGLSAFEYSTESGFVVSKLTYLGLICYIFWYTLFLYCVYVAYSKDQSILRMLYDTKLKQYGDDYERAATLVYVLYAMWKVPFNVMRNTEYVQFTTEIDKVMRKLGLLLDYNRDGQVALVATLSQFLVYFTRTLCICVSLDNLNMIIPFERIFQVVFTDVLALILSGHYCYTLMILRKKYILVNNVLNEIKAQKAWENVVFTRDKIDTEKANRLQEKYICEKIKLCGKIYSMLYKCACSANKSYGFAIAITTLLGSNNIVLYMFYFMEATASGLFNDFQRYVYFLIYVFWQTAYAVIIIFMIIYSSDLTASQADYAAFVIHEIINNDLSPSVTSEAMLLSLQFQHQKVVFTACGLYYLDYTLLYQGARSVVTFLVILLQFVMET